MIARLLARVLEAPLAVHDTPVEPLDAIVVLGAPLARDGGMSRVLAERVAGAIDLYRAGGAPLVVTTGGVTHPGTTPGSTRAEADVAAEALHAAGINNVLVERTSLTTEENANFAAELLAARGARRIWLVTQPFHAKRAAFLFRRAGLEPHIWHLADSIQYRDRRRAARWLMREYASWAVLLVRNRRESPR